MTTLPILSVLDQEIALYEAKVHSYWGDQTQRAQKDVWTCLGGVTWVVGIVPSELKLVFLSFNRFILAVGIKIPAAKTGGKWHSLPGLAPESSCNLSEIISKQP